MKSLSLKVVHRLVINNLLDADGQKGASLSDLNKMLKIVDLFTLTEEESKKLNLRLEARVKDKEIGEDNPLSLKWDTKGKDGEELDIPTVFEMKDDLVEMLKSVLKKKSENKEIKIADAKPILEIAEQVGLEI